MAFPALSKIDTNVLNPTTLVGVKGKDGATIANPAPNPFPVEVENFPAFPAAPDPVGIKGKNGTTISSVANPVPVEVENFPATQAVDTELSAPSVIGDAEAVPSTSRIGAVGMLFNGATYDRWASLGSGGTGGKGIARVYADEGQLDLTFADGIAVGAASTLLLASLAARPGRPILIRVSPDSAFGVHINAGAAATTAKLKLNPGDTLILNTTEAINAIREAAATSDPTVYVVSGLPIT